MRLVVPLGDERGHVEQAAVQASGGDESFRVGGQDGEVAVLLDGAEEKVPPALPGVTEAVRRPFTSVRTVTRSPVIRRTVAPLSAAGAAAARAAWARPFPPRPVSRRPRTGCPAATAAAIRIRRPSLCPSSRVVRRVASLCCSRARGAVGAAQVRSPVRAVSPFRAGRWDMSQRRHGGRHCELSCGKSACHRHQACWLPETGYDQRTFSRLATRHERVRGTVSKAPSLRS